MLQIYRTSTSSYQFKNYFDDEKNKLESIQTVKYISSEEDLDLNHPIILITNTHTKPESISRVILEKTILILHPNSGYDNFPHSFVQNASFPIVLGNQIRSHAVAEYVLSCLFNHFTSIALHENWCKDRSWNRKLIFDQNILLIGHGHLGKILYPSLKALCPKITVFDPYDSVLYGHENFQQIWSHSLVKDKSVIILAAALNETSLNLLNQNFFNNIATDAVIINAARAELIHEEHFLQFMQSNPKACAYLDVFWHEPFPAGHLQQYTNIKKTSHIAGSYNELNQKMIDFEYQIIKDFVHYLGKNNTQDFWSKYSSNILNNKNKKQFLN